MKLRVVKIVDEVEKYNLRVGRMIKLLKKMNLLVSRENIW